MTMIPFLSNSLFVHNFRPTSWISTSVTPVWSALVWNAFDEEKKVEGLWSFKRKIDSGFSFHRSPQDSGYYLSNCWNAPAKWLNARKNDHDEYARCHWCVLHFLVSFSLNCRPELRKHHADAIGASRLFALGEVPQNPNTSKNVSVICDVNEKKRKGTLVAWHVF